ncbi:MAG: TrmH family RNA methyltransferase [Termitinemataceae bacterium]
MIPVHKLQRLPRHQQLRKIEKLLTIFEHQAVGSPLTSERMAIDYLLEILQILAADAGFSNQIQEYLVQQNQICTRIVKASRSEVVADSEQGSWKTGSSRMSMMSDSRSSEPLEQQLRAPVNRIRHLLRSELGLSVADWDYIDEMGTRSRQVQHYFPGVNVYLEDIRSPFNIGSIFRTAESFGVERIYLSPFCADPTHPRAERSAMGTVSMLPWERKNLDSLPDPVFAMETGGSPIEEFIFPSTGTLIIGSEELGVSPEGLERAARSAGRVSILTIGAKGSLNVGVAFGIVMRAWAAALVRVRHHP